MPGHRIAPAASAAALLFLLLPGPEARAADEKEEPPSITVSGRGKVSAAPDVAEITVGVLTQGATAREALAANNDAMNALMGVLKERGVAAKDVQTTNISVNPHYSQPGQPPVPATYVPRIVGYQVSNTVRVTARDLSKLGQVLDAVVQAGGNQMHGIAFRFDDPEKLMDQARKRAMADARRKAELLAGEGGVVLGAPVSIREGGMPVPRPVVMHAMGRAAIAAEPAVPVAPGEQDLNVTVEVVYRIKPAR